MTTGVQKFGEGEDALQFNIVTPDDMARLARLVLLRGLDEPFDAVEARWLVKALIRMLQPQDRVMLMGIVAARLDTPAITPAWEAFHASLESIV